MWRTGNSNFQSTEVLNSLKGFKCFSGACTFGKILDFAKTQALDLIRISKRTPAADRSRDPPASEGGLGNTGTGVARQIGARPERDGPCQPVACLWPACRAVHNRDGTVVR